MPATYAVVLFLLSVLRDGGATAYRATLFLFFPFSLAASMLRVTIGTRKKLSVVRYVARNKISRGVCPRESDRRFVDWKEELKVKRAAGNRVNGKNREAEVRSVKLDWNSFERSFLMFACICTRFCGYTISRKREMGKFFFRPIVTFNVCYFKMCRIL